jgi:TRAP-type C4-dicarboxylate transport system permease large subunit
MSLLVNLVAQMLFYGALATAGRSLTFAALVLGLAVPRRYAIRRLFNTLVAPGTQQSRWQSWFEVCSDTVVAIIMAIILQRLCYGAAATLTKAGGVTVVLYAITLGRRYTLRRVFETWNVRQDNLPMRVRQALAKTPPLREAYNVYAVEATEPRATSVRG